jgi:hypothetical protein
LLRGIDKRVLEVKPVPRHSFGKRGLHGLIEERMLILRSTECPLKFQAFDPVPPAAARVTEKPPDKRAAGEHSRHLVRLSNLRQDLCGPSVSN